MSEYNFKKPLWVHVEAGKTYMWCKCQKSKNQPFCDGSHRGTEFSPVAFVAQKDEDVCLCMCKKTTNEPFCDGTHKKLDQIQLNLNNRPSYKTRVESFQ